MTSIPKSYPRIFPHKPFMRRRCGLGGCKPSWKHTPLRAAFHICHVERNSLGPSSGVQIAHLAQRHRSPAVVSVPVNLFFGRSPLAPPRLSLFGFIPFQYRLAARFPRDSALLITPTPPREGESHGKSKGFRHLGCQSRLGSNLVFSCLTSRMDRSEPGH
jgi:hypothetical protein